MRQKAGCGLVNGPLGNVSTDIIRKKNTTQQIPDHILSWIFDSFLKQNKILLDK